MGKVTNYRVDVWYKPYACYCPGINTYATKQEAEERAAQMKAAGHKVRVVTTDSAQYTI